MLKPVMTAVVLLCSGAAAAAAETASVQKTPAYELLGALDLLQVAPREGLAVAPRLARPDGSSVARIELASEPVAARR